MSVQGVSQLGAQLDTIKRKVSDARFVYEAGMFVKSAAVLLCPVNDGALRQSIGVDAEYDIYWGVRADIYTDMEYAPYVELGTGPKGEAEHAGISPNVTPVYKSHPWWIHESQLAPGTGERYGWFYIDTPDGRFYRCSGQAAQPFLYPALKDNEDKVLEILDKGLRKAIEDAT